MAAIHTTDQGHFPGQPRASLLQECSCICNTVLPKIFTRLQRRAALQGPGSAEKPETRQSKHIAEKRQSRDRLRSEHTRRMAGGGRRLREKRGRERHLSPSVRSRPPEPHPATEESINNKPPPNQHGCCQRNFPTVKITFTAPCQEQYCIVTSPGFQQMEEKMSNLSHEQTPRSGCSDEKQRSFGCTTARQVLYVLTIWQSTVT